MATGAYAGDWDEHPILKMLKLGVKIVFNTDDRAVIGTTLTKELRIAEKDMKIPRQRIFSSVIDGIGASFTSDEHKEHLTNFIRKYWTEYMAVQDDRKLATIVEGQNTHEPEKEAKGSTA